MKEEEKMEFKEKAIIEQFSKRIKHIRKRRHMTQAEFSKSLGITQRGLQYYEKGERLPEMSLFCHSRFSKAGSNDGRIKGIGIIIKRNGLLF